VKSKILWVGLSLLCNFLCAQVSDDFSDGDFSANPVWAGDTADFQVIQGVLRLDAPAESGERVLTTALDIPQATTWRAHVKMEFNPSASNHALFWLTSDRVECDDAASGYAVQLGGTSEDRIRLLRRDGRAGWTELVASPAGWLDTDTAEILLEVVRDAAGCWTLSDDGFTWGPVCDTTFMHAGRVGWTCVYTATRSDRFALDDFAVTGLLELDTIPPQSFECSLLDSVLFQMHFSESVFPSSGAWLGPELDTLYIGDNGRHWLGRLVHPLHSGDSLRGGFSLLHDLSGNAAGPFVFSAVYYEPQPGDLLLSEVMVDPSPSVGLPEVEYVELWNACSYPLQLSHFQLRVGSTTRGLPEKTIPAGGYVLLVDEEVTAYADRPERMRMNLPQLPNGDGTVELLLNDGQQSDYFEYSESTYRDPWKSDGGWSLERGFFGSPDCPHSRWWSASANTTFGGTPGQPNAWVVHEVDRLPPRIRSTGCLNDSTWLVRFSEPLLSLSSQDAGVFDPPLQVLNGGQAPVLSWEPDRKVVRLVFPRDAVPALPFQWQFPEWTDCAGLPLLDGSCWLGFPALPAEGEGLYISEVMFHAWPEQSDFIEIQNDSEAAFDLRDLGIAFYDTVFQVWDSPKWITDESWILEPGATVAIVPSWDWISDPVPLKCSGISASIPQLSSSGGVLVLLSRGLVPIDFAAFNPEWHHPDLRETQGISLQRIGAGWDGLMPSSWVSASSTEGFSSPGCENGVMEGSPPTGKGQIRAAPRIITPNGDGVDDFFQIELAFSEPGYVGDLWVLNENGTAVSQLLQAALFGTMNRCIWQGRDSWGQLVKQGRYALILRARHFNGSVVRDVLELGVLNLSR